jgi:oligosaccharide reducing-end xylanase
VHPAERPLVHGFVSDLANLSVPFRFWRSNDGMLYIIGILATAGKIEF